MDWERLGNLAEAYICLHSALAARFRDFQNLFISRSRDLGGTVSFSGFHLDWERLGNLAEAYICLHSALAALFSRFPEFVDFAIPRSWRDRGFFPGFTWIGSDSGILQKLTFAYIPLWLHVLRDSQNLLISRFRDLGGTVSFSRGSLGLGATRKSCRSLHLLTFRSGCTFFEILSIC